MRKIVRNVGKAIVAAAGFEIHRSSYVRSIPKMTYQEVERLLFFQRCLRIVSHLSGDIVECGVGLGHSLLYLSLLAKEEMKGRKIWAFDSFQGFPDPTEADLSIRNPKRGDVWAQSSVATVSRTLADGGLDGHFLRSSVTLIAGFFSSSLSKYRGSGIALLHIDVDLYQSYLEVLAELYGRVQDGGVVVFDEYLNTTEHEKFPGAAKAIDEFFGERSSHIQRDTNTGKYFIVKS